MAGAPAGTAKIEVRWPRGPLWTTKGFGRWITIFSYMPPENVRRVQEDERAPSKSNS